MLLSSRCLVVRNRLVCLGSPHTPRSAFVLLGSAQSLLLNLQSDLIKRLIHTCLIYFPSRLPDFVNMIYCKIPIGSCILDTLIVISSYSS